MDDVQQDDKHTDPSKGEEPVNESTQPHKVEAEPNGLAHPTGGVALAAPQVFQL
jgi:hypothetical protein